jgi:hypothetical protein
VDFHGGFQPRNLVILWDLELIYDGLYTPETLARHN